ncbi:hypothetical protein PWT90_01439 [Aphanocladium album]|nr:hypothetical protein PWT90_01439 [Aphanocladium album]
MCLKLSFVISDTLRRASSCQPAPSFHRRSRLPFWQRLRSARQDRPQQHVEEGLEVVPIGVGRALQDADGHVELGADDASVVFGLVVAEDGRVQVDQKSSRLLTRTNDTRRTHKLWPRNQRLLLDVEFARSWIGFGQYNVPALVIALSQNERSNVSTSLRPSMGSLQYRPDRSKAQNSVNDSLM